jgi:hypothetical protein
MEKRQPFQQTLLGKLDICMQKTETSQVPVAHTCNPSCSGDRDQEDHCWKPAQGKILQDSILKKKPSLKMGVAMVQAPVAQHKNTKKKPEIRYKSFTLHKY